MRALRNPSARYPPTAERHNLACATRTSPLSDKDFASLLRHTLRTGLALKRMEIVVDIISDPN